MKECKTCRYWSDMLAESIGGAEIQAVCLSQDGPKAQRYTYRYDRCEKWARNHHGAVDQYPDYGESARALYESEEIATND